MATERRADTLDLVARAQVGSPSAREELFVRCHARVLELVARLWGIGLQHLMEHEDAVNEGLIQVLQKLDKFEQRSEPSFWGWTSMVVANRLHDLRRELLAKKRGGGRVRPFADHGSAISLSRLAADNDPVSKPLRDREERERIDRAFAQLSEGQRAIIVHRYLCGMEYADIADLAGHANADSARRAYSEAWKSFKKVTAHLREDGSSDATRNEDRKRAEHEDDK